MTNVYKILSVNLKDIIWKSQIKRETDIEINVKGMKYEDAKWTSWLRIVTTSRIVLNAVTEFAFHMKLRIVYRPAAYILHYCIDNLIAKWSYT
jgi:hypothetical protein